MIAPEDTVESGPTLARRERGRRIQLVSAIVVVASIIALAALGLGGGDPSPRRTETPTGATTEVTRGTLTDSTTLDGRIGYGTATPVRIRAEGTITWLPPSGTVVRRGEPLLRVDNRPVVLLYGAMPMFRELAVTTAAANGGSVSAPSVAAASLEPASVEPGPSRDGSVPNPTPTPPPTPSATIAASGPLTGPDVRQFEANLAALGYGGFTVDRKFTSQTARAVKRWQRHLGRPATGAVGIGDVVYRTGAIRLASAAARVGDDAAGEPLSVTGTTRMVTVQAAAADIGWATPGEHVRVTFPSGRTSTGRIDRVGRQADTGQDGAGQDDGGSGDSDEPEAPSATVPVTVKVADQKGLGKLTSAPVTVAYVSRELRNVLSVPVAALVALAEGGYGVEAVDGDQRRYIAVRAGMFAEGRVQITGDLSAGTVVRVPQ